MAITNQAKHEVQYSFDVQIIVMAQLFRNLGIVLLGQQLARYVNAGLVYDRLDGKIGLLASKRDGALSNGVVPAFP